MKSETKFKNFTFPKLKQTTGPVFVDPNQIKSNSLLTFINQQLSDKKNHPICQMSTNTYYTNDQFQVYKLPSSISILTYNIWFQKHNKQTRFQCILKMLSCSNADFICLQQVTQEFMHLLFAQPKDGWIKNYFASIFVMGWYDTLILTKYKCRFYKIPFQNTSQGRSMLFAELVESQGRNIIVGSMHYQSMGGNQQKRWEQIQAVQNVVQKCERVIIAGDYNFSDFAGENKAIDKSYTDVWLRVHKIGENGHTMPKTTEFNSWRPDHILCKVPSGVELASAQIYKIGQFTIHPFESDDFKKIAVDFIVRTPSDHFGLISWLPMA